VLHSTNTLLCMRCLISVAARKQAFVSNITNLAFFSCLISDYSDIKILYFLDLKRV
jgi:hypothetical protein